MAQSDVFYAVRDSNTAGNASLNIRSDDVASLQFFSSGQDGDLFLDYVADGGDANTLPDADPDTVVSYNGGAPVAFSVLLIGTLPTTNPNGAQRVPDDLEGKQAMLIKIDTNNDGIIDESDPQYVFVLDGTGDLSLWQGWGNGAVSLQGAVVPPPDVYPVCFCAGTEILTPSGYRKVEDLRAGDMVLNDRGEAKPLVWVGESRYSTAALRLQPNLRPIRIPAGAFGPDAPRRDLHVSPQHRVVIEDHQAELLYGTERVLVPAKHLVDTLAETVEPSSGVSYYHLLLEEHEILVADGLPTESFQPARRTIDVMSRENRELIEAVLETLGEEEMLARKDALLSLKRGEALVLARALAARRAAPTPALAAAAGRYPS